MTSEPLLVTETDSSSGLTCRVCSVGGGGLAYLLAWDADNGEQVVVTLCRICQDFLRQHRWRVRMPKPKLEDVEKQVMAEEVAAAETLAVAKEFAVTSQEDLDFVGEVLCDVKSKLKTLEAQKRKIVDPLNQALKAARDLFRPVEQHYAGIEQHLKLSIAKYQLSQETKKREAIAALQAPTTTSDSAQEALTILKDTQNDAPKGVTTTRFWNFRITDSNAVPREYCTPEPGFIRDAVARGERSIPGVEIYEDVRVSARAK